jgi:DNA-binding transcriptional LysR family regulator
MADVFREIDWSLVQSFLAVAELGSLSAAARSLGQSQPTLGRHIKTLETQLGVELFHRHAKGFSLTEMGQSIRPAAEAMRGAMSTISVLAEAEGGTLDGTVRIACSVFAAHFILPPIVTDIREKEPSISVVVQASDDSDNLLFREADIALRMYRPQQLDLKTLHVCDIPMGVFAAKRYLDRRGYPRHMADLFEHDLVGYDTATLILDEMARLGIPATAEDFPVRTDNQTAYWELVRAGAGIGFTQLHVGRADPDVVELAIGLDVPALPVWLTAQETVRKTPRVARVWELIEHGLKTGTYQR